MRVLVSGGSGFVGGAVLRRLECARRFELRATLRRPIEDTVAGVAYLNISEMGPATQWRDALAGVEVVVHAAARVHVMRETIADPMSEFRRVNVAGTLNLALQAAEMGVRRFIFVSSIKVNGEETQPGRPFMSQDAANPFDAYGLSKYEAEQGLWQVSAATGMQIVIVRPPLVYGPGVKANFLSMMSWLYKDIPLPFGAVTHNKRSLVALENLVDLIVTCIDHPLAGNQTFLVSDEQDISTAELLQRIGAALGHPCRLIAVPVPVLMWGARLAGRRDLVCRLISSLQVDMKNTRELLGWRPPISLDRAVEQTAHHFLEQMQR